MTTLIDLLDSAVTRYGHRPALGLRHDDGTTTQWTYRVLDRRADGPGTVLSSGWRGAPAARGGVRSWARAAATRWIDRARGRTPVTAATLPRLYRDAEALLATATRALGHVERGDLAAARAETARRARRTGQTR